MAKHTLFVVPGTWEIHSGISPDSQIGLLAPYGHRMTSDAFEVKFVN